MEEHHFKITDESGRIDKFLAKQLEKTSRSKIQQSINEGHILVNSNEIKANYKIKTNDIIFVRIPEPEPVDVKAEELPIEIIYQDKDIVLVNKAQGRVVHPGAGNPDGTLVNALLYHIDDLSGINGEIRPGIVHRLDKDTSGILVVAKNDEAHVHLSKQLENRSMNRKYRALVHGIIPHETGTIEAPIGRDPENRQQYTVIKTGKEAKTHFTVLERFNEYSLLEVALESGRTHQIRVHMNYIAYPVAGDETYGRRRTLEGKGQFLHAHSLEFVHPRTEKTMKFEAPLPSVFEETLEDLRESTDEMT